MWHTGHRLPTPDLDNSWSASDQNSRVASIGAALFSVLRRQSKRHWTVPPPDTPEGPPDENSRLYFLSP
ncbi:hypothetical protein TNCV_4629801 [Trichonephila clavipes]|nr:hypothetical protein TNCV_4629801 [Trichonephila clavipes]